MLKVILVMLILFCTGLNCSSPEKSTAVKLRCEYLVNPLGIDKTQPRLSWQMSQITGKMGQKEVGYRILVASSRATLAQDVGDLWDTGQISEPHGANVEYGGKPLESFQDCFWKVKLWVQHSDEPGEVTPWSEVAHWSMGMLDQAEWQGSWLGFSPEKQPEHHFAPEWFDHAQWLWYPGDKFAKSLGQHSEDCTRYFKTEIKIENTDNIEWAEMLISVNDAFQVIVNGNVLNKTEIRFNAVGPAPRFDIKPYLVNGQNQIVVKAQKYKINRVLAGVIGVIKIKSREKDVQTVVTDHKWQTRKTENDQWVAVRNLDGASKSWRRTPGWRQKSSSPIFRKEFTASKEISNAKIAISGLGYYELYCNGEKVGDHRLDPAFTNYDHRVLYVCYDLSKFLKKGKNVLGVMLGSGWYDMHTRATWNFDRAPWRGKPKVLAQLNIIYSDGTSENIKTDQSWRANTGPVVNDGIRNGETYDARLEMPGWTAPGFDDSKWSSPEIIEAPKGRLVSQTMPAIKVTEIINPQKIMEPRPGIYVVDMGHNLAGWARIKVTGPAGSRIQLRYAERLDENSEIDQSRNARYVFQGPFQTDTYITKGEEQEVWEPRFTYHGFRYVEVTGWPGKLTKDKIQGCFANTAFGVKGNFECSNKLLNTVTTLTDRAYRSNFFGYPTDCPQREKNGWTGDAHLAAEQAMFNYHNLNSYHKWAYDLFDARSPEGDLPGIVPTGGWGYHRDNGPGWGAASVMIPWYLYLYYGDSRLITDHYELMQGYVDFLNKTFPKHIVEMGRGDWCYLHTKTPGRITSTALYYDITRILAKVAAILGKTDESHKYHNLALKIKEAYNQKFYKGNGIYEPQSQTSQAVSLFYDLVPDSEKELTVTRLVEVIKKANDHIDCGILGAKALFQALSNNGYHDLAYKIATQPDFPGYGDWITKGATTLWEDWTDKEGSLNHVMFGDIITWFYRSLAGINPDPESPGFKHVIIRPLPVAELNYVKAFTESVFGIIRSEWQNQSDKFKLKISIPPNTTASVYLPDGKKYEIESGEYEFESLK